MHFLVFVLWSSLNHTLVKYSLGPVNENNQSTPAIVPYVLNYKGPLLIIIQMFKSMLYSIILAYFSYSKALMHTTLNSLPCVDIQILWK